MGCEQSRAVRRSDMMEFLILLKEIDYQACPMADTYAEKVAKMGRSLPGRLHCLPLSELNSTMEPITHESRPPKLRYIVQNMALPRVMYIKLPKEQIYVRSEEWEHEYLKSQIQEIIMIFGLLGAKTIGYEISDSNDKSTQTGANLTIGDLPIGGEITFESKKGTTSELSGLIRYPEPENLVLTEELLHRPEIHYLPKKYDWRHTIRRRIENGVLSDHFNYHFRRDISFSLGVTGKFQKMGIGFNFGKNSLSDFRINFEIEYYPVDKN